MEAVNKVVLFCSRDVTWKRYDVDFVVDNSRERERILGALAVVIQGDHEELASFLWAGVHHWRGGVRAGQEHGMLRRSGGDAGDGAPTQGQREDVGRPLLRVVASKWHRRERRW